VARRKRARRRRRRRVTNPLRPTALRKRVRRVMGREEKGARRNRNRLRKQATKRRGKKKKVRPISACWLLFRSWPPSDVLNTAFLSVSGARQRVSELVAFSKSLVKRGLRVPVRRDGTWDSA
jgi:ParB-like chromosome segregation protein Spo0J